MKSILLVTYINNKFFYFVLVIILTRINIEFVIYMKNIVTNFDSR